MERLAVPAREADWYFVNWGDVYARLGLSPLAIPGVKIKPHDPVAEVHRSVLPIIGWSAPAKPSVNGSAWLDPILRPYQCQDVTFLREHHGSLLFSEQRTGKTPEVVYAHDPDAGMLIVIGPLSARLAWHEWAARRFGWCVDEDCTLCGSLVELTGAISLGPRPSFLAIEHTKLEPEMIGKHRPHVVFMSFAGARGWAELYAQSPAGTLCVDEAHLALVNKNNETVHAVRKLATTAHRVIMATGTPLWNKVKGLWPMLDIVCPGGFGKYFEFGSRYGLPQLTDHGVVFTGLSYADELRARLGEVMIRRTWNEIQTALPPITRSIELVAISDETRKIAYETAQRLRTMSEAPATVAGEMARLRRLLGEAKMPEAFKLARDAAMDGHSVIVWAWHRDLAEKLTAAFIDAGICTFGPYHGGISHGDREALLLAARAKSGARIFVATIGAAAVGMDLSFASHVVFAELSFTPAEIAQAEMRPFDGKHPISVTFLAADTPEDRGLVQSLIIKLGHMEALGLEAGVGDARDLLTRAFSCSLEVAGSLVDRMLAEMGESL